MAVVEGLHTDAAARLQQLLGAPGGNRLLPLFGPGTFAVCSKCRLKACLLFGGWCRQEINTHGRLQWLQSKCDKTNQGTVS
jgi:hypothetical protein